MIGQQAQCKTWNNDTVADNGSLIQQNTTFSNTLSQDNETIAHDNGSMVHLGDNITFGDNASLIQNNTTLIQSNAS